MAEAPKPGSRVGQYTIVEALGQGGMGVVYKARDDVLGRLVAIKVIAGDLAADAKFMERFRREARAAATISHPNVTAIHQVGESDGLPFLVFELVPGGTLAARAARGPLPWREVASLGEQVASALAAVHAAGLVHRDLKPQNILLDAHGRAKLADFGLVRGTDPASSARGLTEDGEVVGTLEYMSPEQALGEGAVSARSDLYSLGCTLYALLTGKPPFGRSAGGYALLKKQMNEKPVPPSEVARDVPERLERLVLRLLAKSLDARPASADAVARELAEIGRGRKAPLPLFAGVALVSLASLALAVWALAFPSSEGPAAAADDRVASNAARPRTTDPGPKPPAKVDAPRWFLSLPESERPPLPLPKGVRMGEKQGEYVNEKDGSVLVFVPAGAFSLGCSVVTGNISGRQNDDERPVHRVELSGFFLGKYEVTNDQFAAFVRATGHRTSVEERGTAVLYAKRGDGNEPDDVPGASWKNPLGDGRAAPGDHPVVLVSWLDAKAYARWAGLRLPTEAEWEKAASWDAPNGRASRFPWGDDPLPPDPRANIAEVGKRGELRTVPVGSFPLGVSPYGAHDMIGNVSEWCEDVFLEDSYSKLPKTDPLESEDGEKSCRSIRGINWIHLAQRARASMRLFAPPSDCTDLHGLRVARYAAPVSLSIAIDEPSAGSARRGDSLRVRGRILAGPVTGVTVNGTRAHLRHDRFEAELGLKPGETAVRAVASGLEDSHAEASVTLSR
ncbi:SUMF1/EgtB/PvdO family nonheme iron enzyme [bacterium]|nr:SUMF1/EgtB/PvdO family nonheme iron enzyme [bacterium]